MGKNGKRGSGMLGIVASAAFLACCCAVLLFVLKGGSLSGESISESQNEAQGQETQVSWPNCSWGDVAAASAAMESASSMDEARDIAKRYGLVGDDGSLSAQPKQLILSDGSVASARLVGILADDLADGTGKAALSFMAGPLPARAMNEDGTSKGGWEASSLRSWLAGSGLALLPGELASSIKPVAKTTNNVGATPDPASALSSTADALWAPSASEIFGQLTWFAQEYGDNPIWNTAYTDFAPFDSAISSEGAQYEAFAAAGVSDKSDPSGFVGAFLGRLSSNWWLRTPYPVSFIEGDDTLFYQVMASGYPSTLLSAGESNRVVVGFCI